MHTGLHWKQKMQQPQPPRVLRVLQRQAPSTHPFKDINQSKHILGPAAYSALAIELRNNSDEEVGDREIDLAVATASLEIAGLLEKCLFRKMGKKELTSFSINLIMVYETDSNCILLPER